MRRRLSSARLWNKLFRDSIKELVSDHLYYAEQIGKDIDREVREYIFEIKPEVIPW